MINTDPALKRFDDCPTCPFEEEQSPIWLVGIYHQMGWGYWTDGTDISPHPKDEMVYTPWKAVHISEAKKAFKESHLFACEECVGDNRCELYWEGVLKLGREESKQEEHS